MSKPWKPGRETVPLRPSRIRREPVRLETVVVAPRSRERDVWNALLGIALIAVACVALIAGVSVVTGHKLSSAAADSAPVERFGYCRDGAAADCVIDGDTLIIAGETIGIAGIDAPQMHPPRCREEARLGIAATVRLHRLLNGGPVTTTGTGARRDADGRLLRDVQVNGADVGTLMIAAGFAREMASGQHSWCERR